MLETSHFASSFTLTCVAKMDKPSKGNTGPRKRGGRVFMGISWSRPQPMGIGVLVENTFLNMPTQDCLFGGDVILQVSDEPVAKPEDVVFFWDRAAAGAVRFTVKRQETHRFAIGKAAMDNLRIHLQEDASAPIVSTVSWKNNQGEETHGGSAPEELLHTLQQPGFPSLGDLIIGIDNAGVGSREDVEAILRETAGRLEAGGVAEISVRRGCPPAEVGVVGSAWCCTLTRVPKPKRATKMSDVTLQRGDEMTAAPVSMKPKLLDESEASNETSMPEMES